MKIITRPDSSSLVSLRFVFHTGSVEDAPGKGGTAWMTAEMLAGGGSHGRSWKEILDALFPMGVMVAAQVDKEMIAFSPTCTSIIWPIFTRFSAGCCSIRAGARRILNACATMR